MVSASVGASVMGVVCVGEVGDSAPVDWGFRVSGDWMSARLTIYDGFVALGPVV